MEVGQVPSFRLCSWRSCRESISILPKGPETSLPRTCDFAIGAFTISERCHVCLDLRKLIFQC